MLRGFGKTAAEPLTVSPSVPGFRVLRRLGLGGTGTVYEAEQKWPHRRVALKVLRFDSLSDENKARFEFEARALARLQHPSIAKIHDAGRFLGPFGEQPYLVMELIEGRPITEFARGQSRAQKIALVVETCRAIVHAHQRGVLHRDLKPANILVPDDGHPRVLDFSVALDVSEPTRRTRPGGLLGTVAYMSPEQARGDSANLDTRCDVYALGVIAYELLSGTPPHDVARLPLHEAVQVVVERPHLSLGGDDLGVVIDTALAKDPDQRYPSAGAFADDLERVLRHEPISARPPSRLYRFGVFSRRHRTGITLTAISVLILLAMFVQALLTAASERRQRAVANRAQYAAQMMAASSYVEFRDTSSALAVLRGVESSDRGWMWDHLFANLSSEIEAWRFDHDVRIVDLPVPGAPALWSGGVVHLPNGSATRLLPAPGGSACARSVLGDYWILDRKSRLRVAHSEESFDAVPGVTGPIAGLQMDSDGSRALVIQRSDRKTTTLHILDCRTRQLVAKRAFPGEWHARIARSGQLVVVAGGPKGELALWSPDHNRIERRWRAHPLGIPQLAEAVVSGVIATSGTGRSVLVWTVEGTLVSKIDNPGHTVNALSFSPSGARLASGHPAGMVRVWNTASGQLERSLSIDSDATVNNIVWADDSRSLYCTCGSTFTRHRVDPFPARSVLCHHVDEEDGNPFPYVYDVAWSADGRWLGTTGWDRTARICSAETGVVHKTIELPGFGRECEFGPDGTLYVVTGNGLLAGGTESAGATRVRRLDSQALAVHPSGRTVAVGCGSSILRLHPQTLRALEDPIVLDAPVQCLAYSPDGMWLACGTEDGSVVLVTEGKIVRRWTVHGRESWPWDLAWSRDGTSVAVAFESGRVEHRCVPTGELIGHLQVSGRALSVLFGPDDRLLFVGSDEWTIRVWDTLGWNAIGRLPGHRGYVKGLAMTPDGSALASASGDNSVRIWRRHADPTAR